MRAIALVLLAAATAAGGCDRPRSAAPAATAPASDAVPPSAAAIPAPAARDALVSAVGDTVTTAKVKAAIAGDSGMKDSDVSVSTQEGRVVLSGSVKSQEQVTIATNLAQRQEGVSRVETQLTVK